MKDLDFDELDKAVNSLVSQRKQKGDGSSTPPVAAPMAETPEVKPPKDTKASVIPVGRTGRIASKPAASSGRGSFIDIVAPKPAKKAPSRTAATVQPVTPKEELATATQKKPIEPSSSEPPTMTNSKAEKPAAPESEPVKQKNEESWPDPLDFHKDLLDQPAQDKPTKPLESSASPVVQPPQPTQPARELDSPFIAGAKVEKRPLGAYAETAPAAPQPAPIEPNAEEPSTEDSKQNVLPDELKPDVVAVETDESLQGEMDEPPEEPVQTENKPAQSAATQVRDSAMMSIPQQYKTSPKPIDAATRPVFDTKEYHPPLLEETAHAAHRGSGIWAKLFMTLLVLIVLAVGGYLAFIYFVQNF